MNAQGDGAGRRWVLASGNPGKIREFQALLAPHGIAVVPQHLLGIDDAEEPHPTFVENALAKARHAARASGLPALADDSGICVPALGNAPGVRSARFALDADDAPPGLATAGREAIDAANNTRLVRLAATLPAPVAAYYVCVVVLVRHAEDPRPVIAEGLWHGALAARPRGVGGFGYDPHFVPDGGELTAAELAPEIKNRESHRARAFAALAATLQR